MKDYRNKEETFPGHWWEPRVTEQDESRILEHIPEPYVEAISMDSRQQKWGRAHLLELYEPMSWF